MSNSYDLENFLYAIIDEISKTDAPIIFKGGLALKDLLYQKNPNLNIMRKTIDIDANWIGNVDYDEITIVFEQAVKKIEPTYHIEITRLPESGKSLGYKIMDAHNNVISKIDLDIKDNPFYVICSIRHTNIKYSSLEKIMSDKLHAISLSHVFRRPKDLFDIYMILQENDINFIKVKEILNYDNRELGDFSTMLNNKDLLKESYNKLYGIENKPDFDEVWNVILDYLLENNLIKSNKKI